MDRQAIATELAALGKSDKKLLAKLETNRARRCEILTVVAQHADTALPKAALAAVIEPKDE